MQETPPAVSAGGVVIAVKFVILPVALHVKMWFSGRMTENQSGESDAMMEADWIEWAQDVTGQYVTTREQARSAVERIAAEALTLVRDDLPRLRAEAWAEGYGQCRDDERHTARTLVMHRTPNPYRATPPGVT